MIVPSYWAEGRARHIDAVDGKRRQVTMRRFGWSDISQADAQSMADRRAADALSAFLAGDSKLARREPKISYNGAQGVPIREEIVDRVGSIIVTRNGYGARCLNVPDVLFADIDCDMPVPAKLRFGLMGLSLLLSTSIAIFARSGWIAMLGILGAILVGTVLAPFLWQLSLTFRGGAHAVARRRIDQWVRSHPDHSLRVYRTPSGFRVLATHARFEPRGEASRELLAALGSDPLYVRMCVNQNCFRARLTAKPWRAGIPGHMRPRPGVWPVRPERMADRTAWIERYEATADAFAACRFERSLGSGLTDPAVRAVVEYHDRHCRALSDLPTA